MEFNKVLSIELPLELQNGMSKGCGTADVKLHNNPQFVKLIKTGTGASEIVKLEFKPVRLVDIGVV